MKRFLWFIVAFVWASLLYPFVEQTVPYVYRGYDLVKEAVRNEGEQCPPETSDEDPQATEILLDTVRLL